MTLTSEDSAAGPQFSYIQALHLVLTRISPLGSQELQLSQLCGRVSAEKLFAKFESPSEDVSFKDGYAVRSEDVAAASQDHPVILQILDQIAPAGGEWQGEFKPGKAVRILSGARLPAGAQAVVAEEFTQRDGDQLAVLADAGPGRNVLFRGFDIARGQLLLSANEVIQPAQVGLLAAAGYDRARVYLRPRVSILATGDEVIAPGFPLQPGKLYASNLVTLGAWCGSCGMQVSTAVVRDDPDLIRARLQEAHRDSDVVLTSGGAWSGDRDYVVRLLAELGWQKIFHRVRIGPGKAVGFGLLRGKPVFCLPGGPPSNYMAFIQIALPGLLRLAGYRHPCLPSLLARLGDTVRGQMDWTQFVPGRLERREGVLQFIPMKMESRLQSLAETQAILEIPEGREEILAGEDVSVTVLAWPEC